MDFLIYFLLEKILLPFTVICLFGTIFIFLPYYFFIECRKPTFSLKKNEWSCSKEYEYTTSNMILVGKVIVPQVITHHDCIQWNKK